jgi:HEAT repeat protein
MLAGLSGSAAIALFFVPAFAVPQARASEPLEQAAPDESSGQDWRPDVAVAAADPELVSVLKEAAKGDKDPNVRREAVRSLFRLGSDDAVTALVELLDRGTGTETQLFILRNLTRRQCASAQVRAKLSQLAENGQSEVRIVALEQLGRTNDPNAVDKLIAIYKASDRAELKRACLRSLAQLATKPAREFLMEMAKSDPDPSVRSEALRMLVAGVRRPARILVRGPRVLLDRGFTPFDDDLDLELPERLDPGLRDKLDDLDARMGGLFLKTRKLRDQIYLEGPGTPPAPESAPVPPAGGQQPGQLNPTPSPEKE